MANIAKQKIELIKSLAEKLDKSKTGDYVLDALHQFNHDASTHSSLEYDCKILLTPAFNKYKDTFRDFLGNGPKIDFLDLTKLSDAKIESTFRNYHPTLIFSAPSNLSNTTSTAGTATGSASSTSPKTSSASSTSPKTSSTSGTSPKTSSTSSTSIVARKSMTFITQRRAFIDSIPPDLANPINIASRALDGTSILNYVLPLEIQLPNIVPLTIPLDALQDTMDSYNLLVTQERQGIQNPGNMCYMNTALQLLSLIPEFLYMLFVNNADGENQIIHDDPIVKKGLITLRRFMRHIYKLENIVLDNITISHTSEGAIYHYAITLQHLEVNNIIKNFDDSYGSKLFGQQQSIDEFLGQLLDAIKSIPPIAANVFIVRVDTFNRESTSQSIEITKCIAYDHIERSSDHNESIVRVTNNSDIIITDYLYNVQYENTNNAFDMCPRNAAEPLKNKRLIKYYNDIPLGANIITQDHYNGIKNNLAAQGEFYVAESGSYKHHLAGQGELEKEEHGFIKKKTVYVTNKYILLSYMFVEGRRITITNEIINGANTYVLYGSANFTGVVTMLEGLPKASGGHYIFSFYDDTGSEIGYVSDNIVYGGECNNPKVFYLYKKRVPQGLPGGGKAVDYKEKYLKYKTKYLNLKKNI